MTITQRRLFPMFTFIGFLACANNDATTAGGGGSGGAVAGIGGRGSGGSTSTGAGGSSASGGHAGTGGTLGLGGSLATGGTTDTGTAGTAGGLAGSGGTTSGSGGTVTSTGGTGGVTKGTGGSVGGEGGTSATGGIPTGYPTPTAANYSMCQKVPMSAGVCPGGGNGPVCIECLFGGPTPINAFAPTAQATSEAGNYLVIVTLGGAAAGDTFVSAESNRGLLSTVTTAAGKSVEYALAVDVRARESEPTEPTVNAGYPGLDLYFSGTNPEVSAIGYVVATTATRPTNIFIASDSTACDQPTSAFAGWGQMLPEFFGPAVEISNYADSGESSASFYGSSGLWGAVKANWKAGDWVLIQFGHNDKTATDAQVETNLEKYVTDAQAAGVNAVLVSPPARVGNWNGDVLGDQSSLHAVSAMGAAAAKKVPYIDLTALSTAWYNTLGSKAAALKFHANGTDATHTNLAGATMLASIVAGAIKTQNLGLAPYLRANVGSPTGTGGASGGGGAGGSGNGGQGGTGGASPALTQACAKSCAMQTALACVDSNCQNDCLTTAEITPTPGSNATCQTEFLALLGCEGTLAPTNWTCSTDEQEPEPSSGQCTTTVCAWACCVSSLYTTSDIWARCESTCNN
jgi:lysophospholipase L1-like esterase